jgi:hypothetical protein
MNNVITRLGIGELAGIAGLVAMTTTQRLLKPLVKKRAAQPTDVFASERTMSPIGSHHGTNESATDAVGRMAYEQVVGDEPDEGQKRALSWAVHIGYGLAVAGLYGVLEGRKRHSLRHAIRTGALFGIGLWALGDELAVPLLGLADKPTQYHPTRHAQSLAAHLGFGIATATVTNVIGRLS